MKRACQRHVTPGVVLAGTLRVAGHREAHGLYDSLAIGPVARSLPRLDEIRRGLAAGRLGWRGHYRMGELARAVNDLRRGAVLWTTTSWPNRLSLWCLLHALGDDALGVPLAYPMRDGVINEFFNLTRREIEACLASAESVDVRMLAEARTLWSAYAARQPRALARLGWSSLRAFPEARGLFAAYARVLPRETRRRGGSRWRISSFDELLVHRFSRSEWRTPITWMRTEPQAQALFRERGDVCVPERMLALCAGKHALLESRPRPEGPSMWNNLELRLSEAGERALKVGVDELRHVPGLPIGGYVAYRSPYWIAERTGARWSIAEAK